MAHAHDWGTLIYVSCVYCPLTVGDEMERLAEARAKVRELVAQHAEGCGCEAKQGFCEWFGISTIREIERALTAPEKVRVEAPNPFPPGTKVYHSGSV